MLEYTENERDEMMSQQLVDEWALDDDCVGVCLN